MPLPQPLTSILDAHIAELDFLLEQRASLRGAWD